MLDLVTAIHARQVIACTYDGKPRIIEPHAYGYSIKDGGLILRAYQTNDTPAWKLFKVANMVDATIVANAVSEAPRPGYKTGDKYMSQIIAECPARQEAA